MIRSEVLCLVLLLSGVASAAPASETAARAAALEAKKAFDLGDYAKAIEQYEAAYKLKAAPGLLFNLGQSHRRAGHLDKASFYFRRYLETNPPTAQAKATEDVLAEVDAQRASQKTDTTEQQRKEEERLRLEDERTHAAAEQQRLLELEKTRLEVANAQGRRLSLEAALKKEAPPPPVYQRWWFWTAIGVVAVGAAVTVTAVATAPQPVQTTFPDINAR
ncbi:MAG: tetratricopeptide repeat protein [Archangium sp.]|nr:tetratricopeptide repeat protein [Archangium sp.]MDP3575917.1 tetratricopeptide repeat protein [Archangium sp.]